MCLPLTLYVIYDIHIKRQQSTAGVLIKLGYHEEELNEFYIYLSFPIN